MSLANLITATDELAWRNAVRQGKYAVPVNDLRIFYYLFNLRRVLYVLALWTLWPSL